MNDVTAAEPLFENKEFPQWARAKSYPGFGPLGPWIVRGIDPDSLQIQAFLDGEKKQDYPVSDMIFFASRRGLADRSRNGALSGGCHLMRYLGRRGRRNSRRVSLRSSRESQETSSRSSLRERLRGRQEEPINERDSELCHIRKAGKRYLFDKPGNYRIRVLGFLDESWSEKLGSMRIAVCSLKDQEGPVTELVGQVRDQAALAGVLNSLYELHLTLVSVEYPNGD